MPSSLLPPVQAQSRPRLTLLHLTDLHFATPSPQFPSAHYWNREWPGLTQDRDYNQRGLCDSILTDLSDNDWKPDLVIVSGDLLDRGQRSGVELAVHFLTKLSQELSLGRDRFVLVPGNHDEVRGTHSADERYAHFSLIWKGFYGETRPWSAGRRAHEQVELFDLREPLGVQVVGFNSCEGHDSGLHAGAVGTHQRELAEKLLKRSGEAPFRIAVMHHHLYNPPGIRKDLSVMEGAPEIRTWLKRHQFQLALHGHQHVDWREEDSAGDWTLSVVAGASAGVGSYGRLGGDIHLGYQIIGLEDERNGYRFRRWYDSPRRSFAAAGPVAREPLRFGPRSSRRVRAPRNVANGSHPGPPSPQEQRTASGALPFPLPPQYEPVEYLGEGSMGQAFKVRYLGLNEIRVMKVLDTRLASAAAARFFESESEALRSLKHDGFVKIHANESTATHRYTILEYAEGRNLHTVLNECQRLPLEKALLVMRKVVEALEHAHERGIIHCNLNPVNIVVDDEKTWGVRVVDLGAACFLTPRESQALAHRPRAPGLPGYTAPELEDPRQRPTARADLYSVGVILYELLVGSLPEGGSHPLRRAVPERHWRVCDLVDRLLERAPERRPSSASEVLSLLKELEASLTRSEGRLALSTRVAPPAAPDSADPQGSNKPRQPRRSPGSRANINALEVSLSLTVLQRHLPEHFRRSPAGSVAHYAGFFEFLIAHEPKALAAKGQATLLERTAALLEEFNQSLPLSIDGDAGTGKTAFLVALYWYLRKRRDDNPEAPIPLYLNLASYDARTYEGPQETHAGQAQAALLEDLAPHLTLAGRQLKFIVIIDHLDAHGRFCRQLAELALARLPVGSRRSLLVGHRAEQREGSYIRLANLLSFQGVSTKARGFEVFVRQYAEAHGFLSQDVVQRVTRQLQDFKLEVLDYRMLWMLLSSSEYARRPLSLSELHRWECTSYLERHGARGDGFLGLQRPAALAFRYEVLRDPLTPEQPGIDLVSWKLLHEAQQTTRYFLVAVHIIGTLRSAARGGELPPGTYEILSYIYPWMITRFCRELITALDRDMHMIVDAAEAIFDQVPISKHAMMYFLLGRVDNRDSKAKASKLLKKQLQLLARSDLEPNIKKLLERTIEISLIVLNPRGDQSSHAPKVEDPRWQASQRYIKTLIQDPEADMLNRGFLLEYYGDHPFVPKREPIYQDDLAPCPRTFEKHYKHLEGAIARKANYPPLFELELFSLCSLAFHRHEAGCLPEPDRERILRLVTRILTSPRDLKLEFLCPELMLYLQMIEKTLERRMFSSGAVIEDLYALKSELRQSWVQQQPAGRTESVAEHMYGAFLLAWLYLPESPEYSKDRILRMLLLHDLNEAFTGDKLPGEKTNKDQANATQWIEYLSMLGTHTALPGLTSLKEAWSEFAARTTLEGQIAKDFDNLDLLVQSFIYARRHHPPLQSLTAHEKLRNRMTSEVKTPQGIRAREIITRHFDGEFTPLTRKLHPDD